MKLFFGLEGVATVATIAPMAIDHPLRTYRLSRKPPMSQSELARRLGVTRGFIHRIEKGDRQFGAEMLTIVCRRTGLSAEVLRPDLMQLLRQSSRSRVL